jgi:hypothetical protein
MTGDEDEQAASSAVADRRIDRKVVLVVFKGTFAPPTSGTKVLLSRNDDDGARSPAR